MCPFSVTALQICVNFGTHLIKFRSKLCLFYCKPIHTLNDNGKSFSCGSYTKCLRAVPGPVYLSCVWYCIVHTTDSIWRTITAPVYSHLVLHCTYTWRLRRQIHVPFCILQLQSTQFSLPNVSVSLLTGGEERGGLKLARYSPWH
jgi:hypothetical protein